jgi:hypothetical protein
MFFLFHVEENLNTSIREIGHHLQVSQQTVQHILKKQKFFPYTGCLKIASTKKTVASGSPKKSKKPIFNFLKQNG